MSVTIITEPNARERANGPWRWTLEGPSAIPGTKSKQVYGIDGTSLPAAGDTIVLKVQGVDRTFEFSSQYSNAPGTDASLLPVPGAASPSEAAILGDAFRTNPVLEDYTISDSYDSGLERIVIEIEAKKPGTAYALQHVSAASTVVVGVNTPGADAQQVENLRLEAALLVGDELVLRELRSPDAANQATFDFHEVLRDRLRPHMLTPEQLAQTSPIAALDDYRTEITLMYGAQYGDPPISERRRTISPPLEAYRGRYVEGEDLTLSVPQVMADAVVEKTLPLGFPDFVMVSIYGASRIEVSAEAFFADGETRTIMLPTVNLGGFAYVPVGSNLTSITGSYNFARLDHYIITMQYKPSNGDPLVDMGVAIRRNIDHRVDQGGMHLMMWNRQGAVEGWWMAGFRTEAVERDAVLFEQRQEGRRRVEVVHPRDRVQYRIRTGYLEREQMAALREALRWGEALWVKTIEIISPGTDSGFAVTIDGTLINDGGQSSFTVFWDFDQDGSPFGATINAPDNNDGFSDDYWYGTLKPYIEANHSGQNEMLDAFSITGEVYDVSNDLMIVTFQANGSGANTDLTNSNATQGFSLNVFNYVPPVVSTRAVDLIIQPDSLQVLDSFLEKQTAEFTAIPKSIEL